MNAFKKLRLLQCLTADLASFVSQSVQHCQTLWVIFSVLQLLLDKHYPDDLLYREDNLSL